MQASFVFAQGFICKIFFKLFFPLVALSTNFGDAAKLFITSYLLDLRESGRLFV
jgi:hypothetical protein